MTRRILIVDGSSGGFGGVQRNICDVIGASPDSEFLVISLRERVCCDRYRDRGAAVENVFFKSVKGKLKLCQIAIRFSPSLVHTHGPSAALSGLIIKAILRIRHVHTLHGDPYRDKLKIAKNNLSQLSKLKLHIKLAQYHLSLATAEVFSVSANDADDYTRWPFNLLYQIGVLRNGVPRVLDHLPKAPISNEVVRFVVVANHTEQKNISGLLRALALVTDQDTRQWELHVYGGGALFDSHLALLSKLGLKNVYLHGFSANVVQELTRAHYLVSSSYWEGLPYALLEGLSLGLPLVVTPCRGHCEIVEDGRNGFISAGFTDKDIADVFIKALTACTAKKYDKLAARSALVFSDTFEIGKFNNRIRDIYA